MVADRRRVRSPPACSLHSARFTQPFTLHVDPRDYRVVLLALAEAGQIHWRSSSPGVASTGLESQPQFDKKSLLVWLFCTLNCATRLEMAIVVEINSSSSVSSQCDQPAGIVRANPPMAMNRVSDVVNCEGAAADFCRLPHSAALL